MGVNLTKGQKVDLTKGNPGLNKFVVGLGWDVNKFNVSNAFDLDSTVFLTDENGKVTADSDFVFFGNLKHASGAVEHLGDNLTGDGAGDDEQIIVELSKVPANINKIAFCVTIYEPEVRNQNFGQVANSFIRIVNADSNEELLRYDLGEDFSVETTLVTAEIYRHNGEWKFNAIGSGFTGGLKALCQHFGVNV